MRIINKKAVASVDVYWYATTRTTDIRFLTFFHFHILLKSTSTITTSSSFQCFYFLSCPQVHSRLHLILGDPGPHPGDITRHHFPFYAQCDIAAPHVGPMCSGGSWPQLGGNLLGGHPRLHLVSIFYLYISELLCSI